MFMYHVAGAGPDSMLIPKGSRLTLLPEMFIVRFLTCFSPYTLPQMYPSPMQDCDSVYVQTWDHDPVVMQISHLLPAINDWLQNSPVLLQAHSYITESKATILNLPFPIETTLVEYASSERSYH